MGTEANTRPPGFVKSSARYEGTSLPYRFTGWASGDRMSGEVDLGEYGTGLAGAAIQLAQFQRFSSPSFPTAVGATVLAVRHAFVIGKRCDALFLDVASQSWGLPGSRIACLRYVPSAL